MMNGSKKNIPRKNCKISSLLESHFVSSLAYNTKQAPSMYSGTPPYDHPVYKTTSLLRPYSFIILKTPLMRPPRYYDQDFMAQRWSH